MKTNMFSNSFLVLLIVIAIQTVSLQEIQAKNTDNDEFPLVSKGKAAIIYNDSLDADVVKIASAAFSNDIHLITGNKPEILLNPKKTEEYAVIIGTLDKSELIKKLIKSGKLNVGNINGKWESFLITTIEKPFNGTKKALVIVGSDRRGTAFGVFELSKMLGISPWVWWSDVLPKHRDALFFNSKSVVFGPPSVKYRGIFLNDEDWGLKPWASKNLDTDIQDIGPKTYAKIFELMLRLKANFLWPAMHDCTKAFYFYPENPKVADKYAIVVGSSHCEPILRNNVFEWKENFKNEYGVDPGEWRYDLNKNQIHKYWDDRAKQSAKYESVYTVGMRGIHDGSMPGPKDVNLKLKLLDTVITDQRQILSTEIGKPANQIPQIFCPYKEVLTLYQRGLKLPSDVTIVWADDNHGYIRQLSTPEEQKRSGGSGVYYHLSYWGSPHDYLWLSSISPSQIAFELTKAYSYGADRLWIINVGDIKPAELELEYTMDLAWDITNGTPQKAFEYVKLWATRTFGEEFADSIAYIKSQYYKLAQSGKPEHLGLLTFSNEEMISRISSYQEIANKAEKLYKTMPLQLKDAFFQLIYYPVNGALLMNQKIFYARISLELAKQNHSKALEYANKSKYAFEKIQQLTQKYNEEISGGKWNGMMSWKPRNLEVFKMPKTASEISLSDTVKNNEPNIAEPTAVENKPIAEKIILPASSYSKKLEKSGQTITLFTGLGIDGKGIGIKPFTANPVGNSEINTATYIEYTFTSKPGLHNINIKCLPTHSIYKGRDVRYGISINNDSIQIISVNAPAESATWKKNVIRGYSVGNSKHQINNAGESTIRIYLPEPGIILNQIEIE